MIYNVASSLGQPVQKFPQCRNQFRASQTIEMEMITLNSGFEASAVLASASPVEINRNTENIAMTVAVALQEIAYFNSFNSDCFPTNILLNNKMLDNSLIIWYLLTFAVSVLTES